jgi:hypothetical protein
MTREKVPAQVQDLARRLHRSLEEEVRLRKALNILLDRNLMLEAENDGFVKTITRQNREILDLKQLLRAEVADE